MTTFKAILVLWATLSYLLNLQRNVDAQRVVFFPPPQGNSPYKYFLKMAEEVHARGHEASMLTTHLMKKQVSQVKQVDYTLNCKNANVHEMFLNELNKNTHLQSPIMSFNSVLKTQRDCCESVMQDNSSVNELKDADMIVLLSFYPCSAFIAEYFKKPFIVIHSCCFPVFGYHAKVPTPPSYVPLSTFRETSDQMTFLERTMNIFAVLFGWMIGEKLINYHMGEFTQKYKIEKTFADIFAQAEMHLVNNDFAVEFAHPLMPNVFYVGPILARPAEKLSPEFEKIMQDSGDNGVLLVSFGSEISTLPENTMSSIAEAVSNLNQTVIWKVKLPKHIKVSSNVKTFDWIPQQDLLGHEKLKAFVSHMGNNGAYEAAYHGVPLIAACLWIDNLSNAKRFEHKAKMAKFIDLLKANSSEWKNTIEEVIKDQSYKRNALRVSKLIRSRPRTAVQRSGDLIEYALVNGGRLPHLKAHAFNLTWYQYYCIDVMVFLVAVVIFGTLVIVKLVKFICWCFRGTLPRDKLKEN